MHHSRENHGDDSDNDSMVSRSHDPSAVIGSVIKLDFNYITGTWFGRVKFLQLIFCMLAGCLLPSAIGAFFTRFSFYTFVIWTCFMYISIDLFVHVTSLSRMLPDFCRTTDIMMYPLFIGALTLLLTCSLVAGVADYFRSSSRETRTAFSVAFGFVLMMLFLVEAFLHYKRARNGGRDITCSIPGISTGRRVPNHDNEDLENGNIPRGGRNIVISRPTTAFKNGNDQAPPPYQETTNNVAGGGMAVPLGSYGGSS